LILRKIIKIVVTRYQILRLNTAKSISAGLPQIPLGELKALPRSSRWIWNKGNLLLGEDAENGRGRRGRKNEVRKGRGKEGREGDPRVYL